MDHIVTALESLDRVWELVRWYQSNGNQKLAGLVGYEGVLRRQEDQNANLTLAMPRELDGEKVIEALEHIVASEPTFRGDSFVYHYSRSDGFIDVGHMDKGLGVEVALQYLDGDPARTAAVGNDLNDLSMLRQVALPICPANAEELVKEACAKDGVVSPHNFIGAVRDLLYSMARDA